MVSRWHALSPRELAWCRAVAELRQAAAERDGLRSNTCRMDDVEAHAFGLVGEMLVARHLRIPLFAINHGTGRDDGRDLVAIDGTVVQVRTRDHDEGPHRLDLFVKVDEWEKLEKTVDAIYLVWYSPSLRLARIAGWTTPREFRRFRCGPMPRRDGMLLYYNRHERLRNA